MASNRQTETAEYHFCERPPMIKACSRTPGEMVVPSSQIVFDKF